MEFTQQLIKCVSINDVFELVKQVAMEHLGMDQAGLLLGLADLGAYPQGYVGAFYAPDANTIVVNRKILDKVKRETPELYVPYLFHVLMHEYIHSLGCYDERETRAITAQVCEQLGNKTVAQLSQGLLFPQMMHTEPPQDVSIDYLTGIDRKNTSYIA